MGFYTGPLADYNQILTQSASSPNLIGPALVMRAFTIQTMTDFWGDIPFTEAGTGRLELHAEVRPAVRSVRLHLRVPRSRRVDHDGDGCAVRVEADPVYGLNGQSAAVQAAQWVKLANSLRARAAMRISQANATKARAELTAALAGPVLASNADNAFVPWPGGVLSNPLCLNWAEASTGCGGTRDDQRISERFVDTLKVTQDPRLAKYAEPRAPRRRPSRRPATSPTVASRTATPRRT